MTQLDTLKRPKLTRTQLMSLNAWMCKKALDIMAVKNNDYAGHGGDDPFANFNTCELLGLVDRERGVVVRFLDKARRLISFITGTEMKVKDESVLDTGIDAINYIPILVGCLYEKGAIDLPEEALGYKQ